ncbi:Uncharacterised protein [Mycobacteroides abscessus subsp. massiliense]|nr:Uncharacterised protein [Mycobacteroides abscessus subsp. massiliense]
MQLLQQANSGGGLRLLLCDLDHLGDTGLDIGVPAPQSLAVDDAEPAGLTQFDGKARRNQGIGRMRHHRNLETVGIELPRRRHVLRGTRAARRDDIHIIEFIGATGGSAHADFDQVTHVDFLCRADC